MNDTIEKGMSKWMAEHTNTWMDEQWKRQTGRLTDRPTDGRVNKVKNVSERKEIINRWMDRETNSWKDQEMNK